MIHTLALGFFCNIFKHKPNLRIFFNNIFIDEFDIEPFNFNESIKLPQLNFYQLNLCNFSLQNDVKLVIKNSDSNYNNGFMSKSTLLRLHTFCLFPTDSYAWVLEKIKSGITDLQKNYLESKMFNLIPYTKWFNSNECINDIAYRTIGGSGSFVCELYKNYGFFTPDKLTVTET
jgi:hypothetical protein